MLQPRVERQADVAIALADGDALRGDRARGGGGAAAAPRDSRAAAASVRRPCASVDGTLVAWSSKPRSDASSSRSRYECWWRSSSVASPSRRAGGTSRRRADSTATRRSRHERVARRCRACRRPRAASRRHGAHRSVASVRPRAVVDRAARHLPHARQDARVVLIPAHAVGLAAQMRTHRIVVGFHHLHRAATPAPARRRTRRACRRAAPSAGETVVASRPAWSARPWSAARSPASMPRAVKLAAIAEPP